MAQKFKTKPVEVEAILFNGFNHDELVEWTDHKFNEVDVDDRVDDPEITAEIWDYLHSTWIGVKDGQWIIKGTKGEFYPCDPETFDWKYEPVGDES